MSALNMIFLYSSKGLIFWATLCKQYQTLIQKSSKRANQYILFKIAAAASHTSGFWNVRLHAKLPHHTGHASFLT